MKKILAVTIILAVLVVSTLAFMPSASAQLPGGNCCSYDQSVWSSCQSQGYIKWKNCMGLLGDWVEAYMMGFDW